MSNLTTALIIVASINLMLILGQGAVSALGGNNQFYDEATGSCVKLNPIDGLPDTSQSVDPDTGLSYTDDFSAGKSWLNGDKGSCTTSLINAPTNFIKYLGLPVAVNYAIQIFWYGITIFLLVSWLLGRDA